ncbi:hypothetical protein [Methylocucumis oryzae]|uniref:Orc1-like AAA ATPase domain-containing protein n=1 Tax=Methylocucumis oryzae TaxID=1632867 RepID=A0A0F3IK12_9GAMM|nr:hypothetical protein [Methylocucumis oryzae]KJV07017.1 hypothetical protein VZ94_07530 [Methylocucumis oryzae]
MNRLVERGPANDYSVVSFDVSHCRNEKEFFTKLCQAIENKRGQGDNLLTGLKQRIEQLIKGNTNPSGTWYQNALNIDWETFAEHLITVLAQDSSKWAILIDELPVFFLHLESQPNGLAQVKSLAYRLREFRERFPALRWLITGSIGIEPLARRGEYLGAFNNLEPFALQPLAPEVAQDFLHDYAQGGHVQHRQHISDYEAQALIAASGWLSVYYLEAFARELQGEPAQDAETAQQRIDDARKRLLAPTNRVYFESWPEHIRKNFTQPTQSLLFTVLEQLADTEFGLSLDGLLPLLRNDTLQKKDLQRLLNTLEEDGFTVYDIDREHHRFRMELLRLWWQRYLPE